MQYADSVVWMDHLPDSMMNSYNTDFGLPTPFTGEDLYSLEDEPYDFAFHTPAAVAVSYGILPEFSYQHQDQPPAQFASASAHQAKRPRIERLQSRRHPNYANFPPDLRPIVDDPRDADGADDETSYADSPASARPPRHHRRQNSESTMPGPFSPTNSRMKGGPAGVSGDPNRERNRLAANRCREKSKKYVDDLKDRERELMTQRATLTAHAASLQEEVLQLKSEILGHGDCRCSFIQNYIASAANKQMS